MGEYPKLASAIDGLKIIVNRPARTNRQGETTHWREQELLLSVSESEKLLADLPEAVAKIGEFRQQQREYDLHARQVELDRLREEIYGSQS